MHNGCRDNINERIQDVSKRRDMRLHGSRHVVRSSSESVNQFVAFTREKIKRHHRLSACRRPRYTQYV